MATAKILLSCSIPQDVFTAAGATVKPSLVFLKRFTQEEEITYADVTKKARKEVRETYQNEIARLDEEIRIQNENLEQDPDNRKQTRRKIKEIRIRMAAIEDAIRATQDEIARQIAVRKGKIRALRQKAEELRQLAKREFEEAVFS